MKRLLALLFALILLNASLAWAGHRHVETLLSGLSGEDVIADVTGNPDQGSQVLEGHCDHMASHFFAVTTDKLFVSVFASSTRFAFKSTPLIQITSNPPYQPPRS